jgi:CubicO group peptidase (beta-lactamase class C family)
VTPRFDRTRRVLEDAIANRIFPGAVVEIGDSTRAAATIAVGTLTYDEGSEAASVSTIYDLASLTKVLCTATLAAGLVERGVIDLDDPVRQWSADWQSDDRRHVTVRHLLLHASGLPAHRRYFETLEGGAAYEAAIGGEPLEYPPGEKSVYSDLGFILLGRMIERAGGGGLDTQFDAWRREALPADPPIRFRPPADWLPRVAPTEDDPWRGQVLRGEVHDENAARLGGVAGHAGLFGTAAAVGGCARWWMSRASRGPWATFLARGDVPDSTRALGWDTMRPTSSCGTQMSPTAVGHTGFTGTSLWIDVAADRYVVFLANRVHPSRSGEAMGRVRPALHDAVAGDLMRG